MSKVCAIFPLLAGPCIDRMEQGRQSIPLIETTPGVWEVSARHVQEAMQSGEAILNETLRQSRVDSSERTE